MKHTRTILHPTDFSPHSQQALVLACTLAREEGARLVILHVVPGKGPVPLAEAKNRLERLPLPCLPVREERLLKQGEVAAVIQATAHQVACDLIVMGTHGWTAKPRLVMGGVAEEVAQNALCTVVTVRPSRLAPQPADEPAEEEAGVVL
jgi:nucleotide-binding universal stress UspA family protein